MKDEGAVLAAVEELGLLLVQDKALSNAVEILVGGPVSGSWWGHPEGKRVYAALETITAHPDVLVAKLIARKLTLIHRRLWPAFLAVANAREPWQTRPLSAEAALTLTALDSRRSLEPSPRVAKELELSLLAHSERVHTPSGKHVTRLEPWSRWAVRAGCEPAAMPTAEAKYELQSALMRMGGTADLLPWHDDV
jgi:hypothetical protein